IGSGIIDAPQGHGGLVVVLAGLVGAITWNLITWWKGLPSSSSHALIGGLMGAGLASFSQVHWTVILDKVVIPMVASPLVGFTLAFFAMVGLLWLFRNAAPGKAQRRFRVLQTISAAAMALGHGLQDAQKTMGVIVLALVAGGLHPVGGGIPLWVKLAAAGAISAGTYAGGWRIMRTLGRKVIELDPARGFVAEGSPRACCTRPPSSSTPRSPPPTRSRRRSWGWAPPSGSRPSAGALPGTSPLPGCSRFRPLPSWPPACISCCTCSSDPHRERDRTFACGSSLGDVRHCFPGFFEIALTHPVGLVCKF